MKRVVAGVAVVILFLLLPATATAQTGASFGKRLASKDGQWYLPVASNLNGSDEQRHIDRGSVAAWDIVVPMGTPAYSMGPGVVEYAGCNNYGGYGCWVYIDHGPFKALYAHMMSGSIVVSANQKVDVTNVIGKVGFTGITSFGPHVHLEMHVCNGTGGAPCSGRRRYWIDQWFDRNQMVFCRLCSVGGQPVTASNLAVTTGGQPVAARSTSGLAPNGSTTYPLQVIGLCIFMLGLAFLRYIFAERRHYRPWQDAAIAVIIITIPAWMPLWIGVSLGMPLAGQAAPPAVTQTTAIAAGATAGNKTAWAHAYTFMRRWEGSKCTHDPVRTFKGVTDSTYNKWRTKNGFGRGDVCRDMTDEQMRSIYHDEFWVASGAYQLPGKVAIMMFDWYVNAGYGDSGSAKQALAACGNDLSCLAERRNTFYLNASGCSLYCAGWLNRLRDIVSYLNKL